jgi:hypothetical protein
MAGGSLICNSLQIKMGPRESCMIYAATFWCYFFSGYTKGWQSCVLCWVKIHSVQSCCCLGVAQLLLLSLAPALISHICCPGAIKAPSSPHTYYTISSRAPLYLSWVGAILYTQSPFCSLLLRKNRVAVLIKTSHAGR